MTADADSSLDERFPLQHLSGGETLIHHHGVTRAQPPPEGPVVNMLQSSMGTDP